MNNIRQVLLKLNMECKGNWDKIYQAIKDKISVNGDDIIVKHNYVTILDNNYPSSLKNGFKPPFVIFYDGDLSLLENGNKILISGIKDTTDRVIKIVDDLSKRYTLVSYYDNDFDKEILKVAIKNHTKYILIIDKPLDEIKKDDPIIDYAYKNDCLIISEYGFEIDDNEYASIMRYRIVAPFIKGLFIVSSISNDPKINLLIEATLTHSGGIYVLPEPPFEDSFNNRLIRDGAFIVDSIIDLNI